VQADSSHFAGPYVGISGSGYGAQFSGSSNAGVGEPTENVSLGQVAPITGIEVGYVLPLGSSFLVDVGASYFQGAASLEYHHDSVKNGTDTMTPKQNISFTIDDLVSYYIAPTLVLSDS
jgi:hypothetical protein